MYPWGGVAESRDFCEVWLGQTDMVVGEGGNLGSGDEPSGGIFDIFPPGVLCRPEYFDTS